MTEPKILVRCDVLESLIANTEDLYDTGTVAGYPLDVDGLLAEIAAARKAQESHRA